MNVLDLFSGAGGFSKGFEKEGFNIIVANEINPQIAETYKYNHKNTIMFNLDIKEFAENLEEYLKNINKKIDIVIGGPPCQGFSMAGARIRKGEGKFLNDERNYLFKHYFKIIQKLEPEYFIMENVEGLLSMKNGEIIDEIYKLFEDENNFKEGRYYLNKNVFDLSEFGVPQIRRRLVIIGSKKRIVNINNHIENLKIKNKDIFKKVTIKEAISDLNFLDNAEGNIKQEYKSKYLSEFQKERRKNSNILYNHIATKHNEKALDRIKKIKPGDNWESLNEKISSIHSGAYGRMKWEDLSVTITTRFDTPSAGRYIHPEKNRVITPREAARLQTFDDDFIFLGSKTSICTQIGNAVPPLFSKLLAKIIKKEINITQREE